MKRRYTVRLRTLAVCLVLPRVAHAQWRPTDEFDGDTPYSDVSTTPLPLVAMPLPSERSVPAEVVRGPYRSVQVNVDAWGQNIGGDAANEPSIVIDPNDPRKMAIGWRQFNAPYNSYLREAGVGCTKNAGHHWMFSGSLAAGMYGSDPVLEADGNGVFYYVSTSPTAAPREMRLFKSLDGGETWSEPNHIAPGYDKPWVTIDRTDSVGFGNIYAIWNQGGFMRSLDGGNAFATFADSGTVPGIGTLTVAPDGTVFAVGAGGSQILVARSDNARYADQSVQFVNASPIILRDPNGIYDVLVSLGGQLVSQPWIAIDHSHGATRGNVYVLTLAFRRIFEAYEFVEFRRSSDCGQAFTEPVNVNDDPPVEGAFKWFPMMSVAPNGRIDVVWADTRNYLSDRFPFGQFAELFYSYSLDAGDTWSPNELLTPAFDHDVGLPTASPKLGDYYTMVSDNLGVNVAYAATFNGEQDIWFLRIGPYDCNGNDVPDMDDIANGTSMNCNGNDIPDECEFAPDMTGDGRVNLADYATLQTCFTGSGEGPVDPCCTRLDTDTDSDIDLNDYPAFDDAYMK